MKTFNSIIFSDMLSFECIRCGEKDHEISAKLKEKLILSVKEKLLYSRFESKLCGHCMYQLRNRISIKRNSIDFNYSELSSSV